MTDIKWEEPPPDGRSRQQLLDYAAIAAELTANPGRWAIVRDGCATANLANQTAVRLKNGQYPSWRPAGSFEAVSRKSGDVWNVYARYVGEPS